MDCPMRSSVAETTFMKTNVGLDQLRQEIINGEPTEESKAFYEKLRKRVRSGQDAGGVYYRHPDGRKEYVKR